MNELLSVGFGAAVTLAAVAVQHLFAQRQQRTARLHESKISMYGDVYADLAANEHWLHNITIGEHDYSGPLRAPDRASTGGRIHLLAPPDVATAWDRYVRADRSLEFHVIESGIRFDMGDSVPDGHDLVLELRAAIEGVRRTVQADLR